MKKNKGRFLIFLGLLLIAAALSLVSYNLYDGLRAAWSANQAVSRLKERMPQEEPAGSADAKGTAGSGTHSKEKDDLTEEVELPDYVLNPEMEMPVEEIDGIGYIGVLRIPDLGLELPVISQWSYPNLRVSPCRYQGSAYLDNLIIAAHNYETHFGLLKTLSQGSEVTFTDVDGNVFCYEVSLLETLAPTAVEEMTSGDYDLTLFTCTIGGASRVTVRCERIS